ncbi:MAG TPA: protein-disulfide reductase DsbD domain-containing protein [Phycisphaerales bacterium]|nr:protein-disulfide reductase DsbD domain-containing protein [Phycisphaerales bacterium]
MTNTAIIAGLIAAAAAAFGAGQPEGKAGKRTAFGLIAEPAGAPPGGEFLLGLTWKLEPGWHTYWQGLNDSGMPAAWELTLPDGWTADEAMWPAPTRHVLPGDIVDHIYEDVVTVVVPIRVAQRAKAGDRVEIKAGARWMVCSEACVLESGDARVTVTVGGEGVKPEDRPARARKIPGASRIPEPLLADAGIGVSITNDTLVFEGRKGVTALAYFPAEDATPPADMVDGCEARGATLRVALRASEGKKPLGKGVLRVDRGAERAWYVIDTTDKSPAPADRVLRKDDSR